MKSLFSLLLSVLLISFNAFSEIAFSHEIKSSWSFSAIHPLFAGDSKSHIVNYYRDGDGNSKMTYNVVNSEFQIEKSVSFQLPRYIRSYSYSYNDDDEYIGTALASYNHYTLGDSGLESGGLLTKSFWSKTSDYEYIIPILGNSPVSVSDGHVIYQTPAIGIAVKDFNGNTITEIRFPKGYYGYSYVDVICNLFAIDGKYHATFPVVNAEGESYTLVYDLGTYSGSNKVVTSPKFVSVSPSFVNPGEQVNVSIDGYEGEDKKINVVAANGQIVFSCNTADSQVSIPSHLLPKGLNVVTVTVNGHTFEATKIISR